MTSDNTPSEIDDADLDAATGGATAPAKKKDIADHFKIDMPPFATDRVTDSFETTKKIVAEGGGNDI
ncbi:MAG: hypothetical protein AAFN51_11060 [Pseudomonadota bacterium]